MTLLSLFCGLSCVARAGLRAAVCLLLTARLLPAEKPDAKDFLTGFSGAALLAALSALAGVPAPVCMALEAAWAAACARRLLRADARMALFVSIFYQIAVSLWQFLSMAGLGILFRDPAFLDSGTACGQAAAWLLHGLLVACAATLSRAPDGGSAGAARAAALAAVAGLLGVITLSEQSVLPLPEDTLTVWTILAVALLLALLVFGLRRQYEAEKELARLRAEQAALLERDYTALRSAYAVNARLFHDFHNHIGALRQLLACGHYAEAVQYLDELQTPVREMAGTVWTGDAAADYLINAKHAAAAADGILFQVQAEFPRRANIQSADLCAVLGNLLDNALEAARQVPAPEQRFVQLTIRRIHQMLVIKVENGFSVPPVQEGGQLKTAKTGGLHGWGLESARTAAEKYDGTVQTSCADGVFRAVATLSYEGVPPEAPPP